MTDKTQKRQTLTREKVLRAAMRIADREGIDKLTMRRLAKGLGVEAMSLYNHIAGKADLLSALIDLVAAEIDAPRPGGDWQAEMRRRAHSAHATLMHHPWAAPHFIGNATPGPAMLALVDATIGCLVTAGFGWAAADHAWQAIDGHIVGFTMQRLNFPFAPEDHARAARENMHLIPAETFPYLRGLAEEVASGRHDGIQDFDFGLDILLSGLEARRGD
jgi:AcrR family transcriptional regulator